MQCDGEPWEQGPGVVDIALDHSATMLQLLEEPRREAESGDGLRHRRVHSY